MFLVRFPGFAIYFLCLRRNNHVNGILPGKKNGGVVINGNYGYEEHDLNVTTVTEMDETTNSSEAIKNEDAPPNDVSEVLRSVTPDVIPKFDKHLSTDGIDAFPESHQSSSGYRISKARNMFDEIISAEDVKNTCIEMKEPDGKVYFVQQINQITKDLAPSYHKDESIALEILDSVIKSEDWPHEVKRNSKINDRPFEKYDVMYEEVGCGGSVVHDQLQTNAIRNEAFEQKSDNGEIFGHIDQTESDIQVIITDPGGPKTEPEYATVKRMPSSPLPVLKLQSFDETSFPLETKEISHPDGHSYNFKDRLSTIIGLQSEHNGHGASAPSIGKTKTTTSPPAVRLSKSSSDLLELVPNTNAGAATSTVSLEPPRTTPCEIPAPPRFDPLLYNTIGARTKTHPRPQLPATAQSIENEFEKAFQRSLQGPRTFDEVHLRRVPRSEALDKADDDVNFDSDESKRMTTIRERLEKILCRGPPARTSFRKSLSEPPPDYPDAPGASKSESVEADDDVLRYRKPIKPFDTVHKQKVLFNDVLKSISPDIRTSLHRTDSSASTSTRTVAYSSTPSEDKI